MSWAELENINRKYKHTRTYTRILHQEQNEHEEHSETWQPRGGEEGGEGATATSKAFAATKRRCLSFRDDLAFSARSKMYVLELNFKRRLQRLRRFARERLPWMFLSSGQRTERNILRNLEQVIGANCSEVPRRTMLMAAEAAALATAARNCSSSQPTGNCNQPLNYQALHSDAISLRSHQLQQQQQLNQVRETKRNVELERDSKFWSKIGPNSLEPFGVQKEKILSRLERTLQAKRQLGSESQQEQQLFSFSSAASIATSLSSQAAGAGSNRSRSGCDGGSSASSFCSGASDRNGSGVKPPRLPTPPGADGVSSTRQTSLSGLAVISSNSTALPSAPAKADEAIGHRAQNSSATSKVSSSSGRGRGVRGGRAEGGASRPSIAQECCRYH